MLGQLRSFSVGLACGASVGALLTLLTTPDSGDNLRLKAKQRYQNILEESLLAAEARRAALRQEFAARTALPEPTSDTSER